MRISQSIKGCIFAFLLLGACGRGGENDVGGGDQGDGGSGGDAAVCGDGSCNTMCSPQETSCNGACVDLQSNPRNCGACGNDCGTKVCSEGACANRCAQG